MNNNEKLLRLLGWTLEEDFDANQYTGRWVNPDKRDVIFDELPDLSNSYELCRRWIIPEMRERGYGYCIPLTFDARTNPNGNWFEWESLTDRTSPIDIKDDNIAAALVEAAIEVLGKDNG